MIAEELKAKLITAQNNGARLRPVDLSPEEITLLATEFRPKLPSGFSEEQRERMRGWYLCTDVSKCVEANSKAPSGFQLGWAVKLDGEAALPVSLFTDSRPGETFGWARQLLSEAFFEYADETKFPQQETE